MIYIKEYGTRRTFTNYFYVLVHHNFSNACVLPSPLGSKHDEPVNYDTWLADETATPRFDTTEYRNLVADLKAHLKDLKFAVLIKDPYAWLLSLIELRHRQGNEAILHNTEKHISTLARFNEKYRAWKALYEAHPDRAIVIRYEDILRDFKAPLKVMEQRFGLKRCRPKLANVAKKVNQCERVHKSGFKKKDFYLNRDYFRHPRYTAEMFRAVSRTVDWKLMKWYGYHKEQAKRWGFRKR